MPVPATNGMLRKRIYEMRIGDYIPCTFDPVNYTFYAVGGPIFNEIPVTGSTYGGTFYFIKADRGLLIADRVVYVNVSWNTLNNNKLIEGKPYVLDGVSGIIRSLTGGVYPADQYGNKNSSATDAGYGGWPTDNEWDKYIVNSSLNGNITPGDDNVWNWSNIYTIVKDTHLYDISYRTIRGKDSVRYISYKHGSAADITHGFRPVFEYKE